MFESIATRRADFTLPKVEIYNYEPFINNLVDVATITGESSEQLGTLVVTNKSRNLDVVETVTVFSWPVVLVAVCLAFVLLKLLCVYRFNASVWLLLRGLLHQLLIETTTTRQKAGVCLFAMLFFFMHTIYSNSMSTDMVASKQPELIDSLEDFAYSPSTGYIMIVSVSSLFKQLIMQQSNNAVYRTIVEKKINPNKSYTDMRDTASMIWNMRNDRAAISIAPQRHIYFMRLHCIEKINKEGSGEIQQQVYYHRSRSRFEKVFHTRLLSTKANNAIRRRVNAASVAADSYGISQYWEGEIPKRLISFGVDEHKIEKCLQTEGYQENSVLDMKSLSFQNIKYFCCILATCKVIACVLFACEIRKSNRQRRLQKDARKPQRTRIQRKLAW